VERRYTGVLHIKGWVEQMFLGQYHHNLDSKNRLTIPSRFRELLADGAYVMQGFDRNLMVLTASAFAKIYQRSNLMSLTDPITRLLKRLIFSTASHVDVDNAGRILIPEFLRQVIDLQSEAVVVGVGDYFEIWSPDLWTEQINQLQDAEANAQRFAALDMSTG
jgi:MraZ protein